MGKRELLLVLAFVIAGAVVYRFTAPPPAAGERGFSVSQLVNHIRRGVRGNHSSAETTTTSHYPVDVTQSELRLNLRNGEITIVGEDRPDIEAELRVRSNGFDEAEAQQLARAVAVKIDKAGSQLVASVAFPEAGSQRARLTLKVPARLQVMIETNYGPLTVSGVAGLELASSHGRGEIRKVAGRVTGTYRGGELLVADSGSVKLTTAGTDVKLEQIRGDVTLNMRSGELKAGELGGPIDLDTTGTDISLDKLDNATGILRINAASGSVTLNGLRTEGRIDVHNAEVNAVIDHAAPLAIFSEGGDPVNITPPAGGYQLDAVASNAEINLPEQTLPITTTGREHRASGPVRGGGPTITVRSAHGDITVRNR
jgi:hypothetical protein